MSPCTGPPNVIAHLAVRDVPLDGTFGWTGLLVGGAVHLTMSVQFGLLLRFVGPVPGIGVWSATRTPVARLG